MMQVPKKMPRSWSTGLEVLIQVDVSNAWTNCFEAGRVDSGPGNTLCLSDQRLECLAASTADPKPKPRTPITLAVGQN